MTDLMDLVRNINELENEGYLHLSNLIANAQRAYASMDDAVMSEADFIVDFLQNYWGYQIEVLEFAKATDACPCPFCGGKEIVFEKYLRPAGVRWRIWCTSCLAGIDPGYAQDKHTALEMWNRRVEGGSKHE